jgi:lipoyl(octanoyl) transferase
MVWRLLSDDGHAAAWNMALDLAILEAVEAGIAPPTLRVYEWVETAVTVGRFQRVEKDIDLSYCKKHSIPIIRRPTGGRGILHGGDITVSIAIPVELLGHPSSVRAAYSKFTEGFRLAFESLGLPITQGECERPGSRSGDCFQIHSVVDLVTANGAKIVGSAMRRMPSIVLLQSSIRHRRAEVAAASVFRGPAVEEHFPLEHLEADDIHEAVTSGMQAVFGAGFRKGNITGWEEERAALLLKSLEVPENSADN